MRIVKVMVVSKPSTEVLENSKKANYMQTLQKEKKLI
jgi:hypothetical protein